MNLTDELRKLADLHQAGHLTDQEFSEAKRRVIADDNTAPPIRPKDQNPIISGSPISDKTYQSSRWSSGNLFFPDTLALSSDGILLRKGAMFGSSEELINYRAIASFRIVNGIFLSKVSIETSGGSQPIFMNGIWKAEAREIQDAIRESQKKASPSLHG